MHTASADKPWRSLAHDMGGERAVFMEHGTSPSVVEVRGRLRAPGVVPHDASVDPPATRLTRIPSDYVPCLTHPFRGGTATRYVRSADECERLSDEMSETVRRRLDTDTRTAVHAQSVVVDDAAQTRLWCTQRAAEPHTLAVKASSLRSCVHALRSRDTNAHLRGIQYDEASQTCAIASAVTDDDVGSRTRDSSAFYCAPR